MTVSVQGSGLGRVPRPQLPDLAGFENLGSTSSQSTSISMTNGRVTQSVTQDFIYFLAARLEGVLAIGPCRINVGGTEYTTAPVTITVTQQAQTRPQPQQPAPFDPWGFFSAPEPRRQARPQGAAPELAVAVDRTSVYQGEQVVATYTFYTTQEVGQLGIKQSPSLSGFWAENLYEPDRLNYQTRNRNGQNWYAAVIRQVALFPQQSGELTVDRMTLAGALLRPGFFGYDQVPLEVSSEPIRITVRPLPEAGRPADFCGGVGEFELSAGLSSTTSNAGEPVNLAVRVSGTGNIGLIQAPALPAVPGAKVLAPETKDNIKRGSKVSGTRDFVFPLIPQADGKAVIPELTMSFFNPRTGQYYTLRTGRLEFVATGTAAAPRPDAGGVQVLGTDIAHIRPRSGPAGPGWATPWWLWLFYPAGVVVLAAGAVAGRHQRRLGSDRGYARRTRSGRLVKQRLKAAAQLLGQSRTAEFHAALNQAVVGFVGDRFNLEAGALTQDQLRQELVGRGIAPEALEHLMSLVADCDVARFSPGMAVCEPAELLRKAQELLEKL